MRLTQVPWRPTTVLSTVVVAAAATFVAARVLPASNRLTDARPFRLVDSTVGSELAGPVGIIAVSTMFGVTATAPFTVTSVRPLRTDPLVDLLAVRAMFWGRDGWRSESGYVFHSTNPGNDCGIGPITGHGPTYPVEGLTLRPGETARFVYYIRSSAPGRRGAYGFEIDYTMPDGSHGRVKGDDSETVVIQTAPGQPRPPGRWLDTCPHDVWTSPYRGYPD